MFTALHCRHNLLFTAAAGCYNNNLSDEAGLQLSLQWSSLQQPRLQAHTLTSAGCRLGQIGNGLDYTVGKSRKLYTFKLIGTIPKYEMKTFYFPFSLL